MMMIITKLATLIMMMMASLTMLMVKKHLFRQSKINYTVLKDSPYMEYFKVTSPFRTFIDLGIAIFPLQKGLTRDTKDFKGKYVLRERQIQTVKFQKISVTKKQS